MAREQITLTHGKKIWSCEVDGNELIIKSGTIGGKLRERRVPRKTAAGRNSIEWELMSLAWKEFKKGFRYDAPSDSSLRWLVRAPEGMGIGPGEAALTTDERGVLVCQGSDGNGSRIHQVDLVNGESRLIHRDPGYLLRGVQGLTGDRVLFSPESKGASWKTALLDANGNEETLLECRLIMMDCLMAATPDAKRIVGVDEFDVVVLDGDDRREIYRRRIPESKHSQGRALCLSPDGRRLVLGLPREGQPAELVFVDLDGSSERVHHTAIDADFDSLVWVEEGAAVLERFQKPQIWTEAGRRREIPCDWAGSLASSPNGRYLAAYQSGRVEMYDLTDDSVVFQCHEPLHLKGGTLVIGSRGVLVTTGGGLIGRWSTGLPTG